MPTPLTYATLPAGIAMRPFTEAQFHCMTALIPQMSQADQDGIRAYLCDPKNNPISSLVDRLIASSPFFASEYEDQPFDRQRLALGPLLFWGLTQPWAKECDIPGCLAAWSLRLLGDSRITTNLASALLGLGVQPLVDVDNLQLDTAGKERLCGTLYSTLQALVPWGNASSPNDMVLAPLWHLATRSPSEKIGNDSLRVHWGKCMRRAMTSVSVMDQKRALLSIATKGLNNSSLLAMFKSADPLVWLMPEFRTTLTRLLPESERSRCKALVWASKEWRPPVGQPMRAGDINRQLHETYCPLMYMGLDMIAPDTKQWEDRAYIASFVETFSKNASDAPPLDLPEDLHSEAPAP